MYRVLFVDDEAGFLDVMGRRLRRRGYEAELATSGEAALAVLSAADGEGFALMVTDLKMPGMDGLGLLAALKERAVGVPVILLTGHAGDEEAQAALDLGAVAYLHKPCDFEDLLACFERIVGVG